MSRSLYKLPFLNNEVILKSLKLKRKNRRNITFYQKNTKVPFCFINKNLSIYQGSFFKSYKFRKKPLGLTMGEFIFTRKQFRSKNKGVQKVKKIKKNTQSVKKLNFTRNGFFI